MISLSINLAEGIEILKPLTYFVVGIAIYSVFIFKFYRFIAKRDVFQLDMNKYNTASHPMLNKFVGFIFYIVKYILLFPIFTFFWFGVLTFLLSFLSKNHDLQTVLLVSIAVVGAVRFTAYYNEDLSRDLAKMLPFALLAVYLVDTTYFSFSESIEMIKQVPSVWNILIYYLIFVILLEFVLRIFSLFFKRRGRSEGDNAEVDQAVLESENL